MMWPRMRWSRLLGTASSLLVGCWPSQRSTRPTQATARGRESRSRGQRTAPRRRCCRPPAEPWRRAGTTVVTRSGQAEEVEEARAAPRHAPGLRTPIRPTSCCPLELGSPRHPNDPSGDAAVYCRWPASQSTAGAQAASRFGLQPGSDRGGSEAVTALRITRDARSSLPAAERGPSPETAMSRWRGGSGRSGSPPEQDAT
jgi:hypothetical protein